MREDIEKLFKNPNLLKLKLRKHGWSGKAIGQKLGICESAVYYALRGEKGHITDEKICLVKNMVENILNGHEKKDTAEIIENTGVSEVLSFDNPYKACVQSIKNIKKIMSRGKVSLTKVARVSDVSVDALKQTLNADDETLSVAERIRRLDRIQKSLLKEEKSKIFTDVPEDTVKTPVITTDIKPTEAEIAKNCVTTNVVSETKSQLHVRLLAYAPDADKLVASAAKVCYSSCGADDIFNGLDGSKIGGFIEKLEQSGHMSPFEHVSYTFAIEGISRVSTHQLVRHRLASYSQQSQRYVNMSDNGFVIPPSIASSPKAMERMRILEQITDVYTKLVEEDGIPQEDARYILPSAAVSNIVVTMNARELLHFFELRCCRRAQWEIREMATLMLKEVCKVSPRLFAHAGPRCLTEGKCPEARPCGFTPYRSLSELIS